MHDAGLKVVNDPDSDLILATALQKYEDERAPAPTDPQDCSPPSRRGIDTWATPGAQKVFLKFRPENISHQN